MNENDGKGQQQQQQDDGPSKESLESIAGEETEFGDAFDEFADGKGGEGDGEDADDDDGDDGDSGDAGDAGEGEGEPGEGKGASQGDGKGSQSRVDAGSQAGGAQGDSGAAKGQQQQSSEFQPLTDDEIKALPEAARDSYNAMLQRWRSDRGRYNAFQTLMNDRDNTIRTLRTQIASSRQGGNQGQQQPTGQQQGNQGQQQQPGKVESRAQRFLQSEKWKKAKEDYPDFAEAFEEVVQGFANENDQLANAYNQLSDRVGNVSRSQAASVDADNKADLSDRVPGWDQWRSMPEFQAWFLEQPKHIQAWGRENATSIVNVDTAADLFGRFKDHMEAAGTPLPSPQQQTQQPANGAANGNGQQQQQQPVKQKPTQSARRQRQLNASRTVQQKGPAPKEGEPDTFDAAFDQFSAAKEKRRAAGLA